MNRDQTLEEQREELKERWNTLKTEMDAIGYNEKNFENADLAMWATAKSVQVNIIFEQSITKETNKRIDELLKETHVTMFWDAVALGQKL